MAGGGVTNQGAGTLETIASYGLPVLAGVAASLHPAAARGLAGLTSAVDTQTRLRLIGQQEQKDRELGMRLSDLLKSDTGVQIPDVEKFQTGIENVTGTPEGPVPMPQMTTRPQRLSEAIGPYSSKLVQALIDAGHAGQASQLLATQAFQKPQYHVIEEYDKETGTMRPKAVDITKPGYLGAGRPYMTPQEYLAGGQQPSETPGIPEPPPGPPPTELPPGPISEEPPVSPTTRTPGQRPTPRVTSHYSPKTGEVSLTTAPGEYGFSQSTIRGNDGRNYLIEQPRDPATGAYGPPRILGEAPANEKQSEIEGRMREFPGLERGTAPYWQLYGELSNLPSDPRLQAETITDIRRRYARFRTAAPQQQSAAPENAPAQPRTPAPAPTYSPTQSGVVPTPQAQAPAEGPIEGADYQAIQERAAATERRQEAAKAGAITSAQRENRELGQDEQRQVAGHSEILAAIQAINQNFKPDEIKTFVGLSNRPWNEAKLAIEGMGWPQGMERYAKFKAMNARLKRTAFDIGGKQLTPFEAAVVYDLVPTGAERGGITEYQAKMDTLGRFMEASRALRLELARQGQGGLSVDQLDRVMQARLGPKFAPDASGKESGSGRVDVLGPNGEDGSVPVGTKLPPGWKLK